MQTGWYEYSGNLHMHTPYSDGALYHRDIAQAAAAAGLDFVVVTDHNVWVRGVEGYYEGRLDGKAQRVLLLTGEEVHDVRRNPQGNHCLVYGAEREVAAYARNPQVLLNTIREAGGLSFLAHPFERAAPLVGEDALPWFDWEITGYTGLEIWNYMSEFKALLRRPLNIWNAITHPEIGITGPFATTLTQWDSLLAAGQRVVGIGGADAHGTLYHRGPIRRVIFPYEYLFRAVNTHVLTPKPLTGNLKSDKSLLYAALGAGHAWVGYDLPGSTRGFRFSAAGWRTQVLMGDEIKLGNGVTLQARVPALMDIRLLRHGQLVHREPRGTNLTYLAAEPGAYRVEVWQTYQGRPRAWILSNPIYVRG